MQYTTVVMSHKALLDLLDVRVQLQLMHTHTHLVTSSGVQIELVNKETHNINMSSTGCTVEYGFSKIVRAVEQRVHLSGEVTDGVDTSALCS